MIVDIVQHQTKLYHMKGAPGKPQISPTDNSSLQPASSDAFNMTHCQIQGGGLVQGVTKLIMTF